MKNFIKVGKFETKEQNEDGNIHDFGTFTAIEPNAKAAAIFKLGSGGYSGGFDVRMRERSE